GIDDWHRSGRRAEQVELPRAFAVIDDGGIRQEALLRFRDLWGVTKPRTRFFEPVCRGFAISDAIGGGGDGVVGADGGAGVGGGGLTLAPPALGSFVANQRARADVHDGRSPSLALHLEVHVLADAVQRAERVD